jgi:hypothetical protein
MISILLCVAIMGYLTVMQMGGPKSAGGSGAGMNYKRAEESAKKAVILIERQQVETAIREYYVRNQKYPPDMETLLKEGFITKIPEGLQYNPENGILAP